MSIHKTVLLNEIIEGLNLKIDSVVLDCTFGGGGHSMEVLRRFPKAKIIALDQDKSVWRKNDERISFYNKNFRTTILLNVLCICPLYLLIHLEEPDFQHKLLQLVQEL